MSDTPPPPADGQAPPPPPTGATPPPPYQQVPPQPAGPLSPADDASRSALAFQLAWLGWAAFIGPLIVWSIFKSRGERVRHEGKEALNFGITVSGIVIVANIVFGILAGIFAPHFDIFYGVSGGVPALFYLFTIINWLVIVGTVIVAAIWSFQGAGVVKAGGSYRYPFALRFIK